MAYQQWSVVYGEQPSASKWNILGTNDAHFYSFLGDNETWTSFTPTWASGLTVGNGTNTGYYKQIGNTVYVRTHFTLGTTSSITDPRLTLPVNTSFSQYQQIGFAGLRDVSATTSYPVWARYEGSQTARLVISSASGTYTQASGTTATIPFTWTTSDTFAFNLVYEAQ